MADSNHVVLVEDDDDIRGLMSDALRRRGFDVEAFDSAKACLTHLESATAPDVVVTDIEMPGMSGVDLCAELRSRHPNLPSIIVSGRGRDRRLAAAARASGASLVMSKPIRAAALEAAIRLTIKPRL
ncbi:MAG: response regulator [Kofleriaceae bacterium]